MSRSSEMLTVAEVASRLKCHPHTIRRWIWAGRLRAVKIGSMTRVPEEEVERLVKPTSDKSLELDSEMPRKGPIALLETMRALREEVEEGDRIEFGSHSLEVIHTPGHTPGGMCLYTNGYVFTGDTLFVGGIGRTDLPGGSMSQLFQSIKNKLFTLPEDTLVFPGHNYGTSPQSTIGREKQYNPFVR